MQNILPSSLMYLAKLCPAPLYVVGGFTRDFLAGLSPKNQKSDLDICSPMHVDALIEAAKKAHLIVQATYKNTGTVKLSDGEGNDFEFTSFRSDKYVRGVHAPIEVFFTDDIMLDATRRDFTCNAVYYDICADKFVDPLGGIPAIQQHRLTTVAPAKKVFGEDGLRLMRLARQAGQLGFTPDEECLEGARTHCELIADISPERIYSELCAILVADEKYGVPGGHYRGVSLLDSTGVLSVLIPELALGKGMKQRSDFHNHDILEHSLRAMLYAPAHLRLPALLHDIGKPYCTLRDGNSYAHPEEGAKLAGELLHRLKAPKREIERIQTLIRWHMYDFNCQTSVFKLRKFFVSHYEHLSDLLAIKQADFSGCKDDLSIAPTCVRWQGILDEMHAQSVPFTRKQLAVTGKDLLNEQIPAPLVSKILQELMMHTAVYPQDNKKPRLLTLANAFYKNIH